MTITLLMLAGVHMNDMSIHGGGMWGASIYENR